MFCTNCGTKFEGNFCPNCGTPAFSSPAPVSAPVSAPVTAPAPVEPAPVSPVSAEPSKYSNPPIGTYSGLYCPSIIVGQESITIEKDLLDNGKKYNIHNEIFYSDIAAVCFDDRRPKRNLLVICIRTEKTMHIPFPGINYSEDPFCAILGLNDEENAFHIYEFLKTVAEINAYQVPEPEPLPKKFKFQSLREYTEYRIQGENPELQAAIQEKKQQGIACCPKCGSTSLSADKQGYSVGKAAFGSLLTGNKGLGLLAGTLGSNKTVVTCLNCGHKWNP